MDSKLRPSLSTVLRIRLAQRLGSRRTKRRDRHLLFEPLEDRRLLAVDWRNPTNPLDVSNDGLISPIDPLQVINELNRTGSYELPTVRGAGKPYWDVNGDQFVAPVDALQVINALIANQTIPYSLGEGQQIATERSITITVGPAAGAETVGTRIYRLQVTPTFMSSDTPSSSRDLFAIYLMDPQQPSQTLLDRGTPGTALFTLSATGAEFTPGRVRWDGQVVELDLSEVTDRDTAELRLQMLNGDAHRGSRVLLRPLSNVVDVEGVASPLLLDTATPSAAGAAFNLTGLPTATNIAVQVENVRYNSAAQQYVAELRLQNQGDSLGRSVAVSFPGLPSGVTLRNPSGTTADDAPYINFAPAITRGGLSKNSRSERLLVEFDNPAGALFTLAPEIFAGANQPPTLAAIDPLTVMPGGVLSTQLTATDPDGDIVTFSLGATGSASASSLNLPTGMLRGYGVLEFTPAPDQLGQYTFDVIASDGVLQSRQTVTLDVIADPLTTTRVSGFVLDVDQSPLAGMQVEVGGVQGLTMSDGSFTLDLGSGPVVGDTLKIRGETFPGPLVYPFIAEKLPFILEHEVFLGVNNVIERPIFLPPLDIANGVTIDPMQDTNVTTAAISGASIFVSAGTLMNQQGTPFTGMLSITEVPVELTPAALPPNLVPDLVVTVQPGEMVFAQPAPLTLPNRSDYAPDTPMELWSINPVTGEFDMVGTGEVSADGSVIETVTGGIRNSSWHFWVARLIRWVTETEDKRCTKCKGMLPAASSVEAYSGALVEAHELAPYQSLGESRGLILQYDSERADPQQVVKMQAEYDLVLVAGFAQRPRIVRMMANLQVSRGSFSVQAPGFAGGQRGLSGGEHFWQLPANSPGTVGMALGIDMRDYPSGVYDFTASGGVVRSVDGGDFTGSMLSSTGSFVMVNSIDSPFGAGWGLAGLDHLVVNPDGSVLLIDGAGHEVVFGVPATPGGAFGSPVGDFSRLERLADGTFRRTTKDQTVFLFNAQNRLSLMRDRNGNEARYDYDAAGRLIRVTDPVGLQTLLAYDAGSGKLHSITDPALRTTVFEHDSAGNLIRITDPDGTSRTFSYDTRHRMIGEIDKRGNTEGVVYTASGRPTAATRRDGTQVQLLPFQSQGLSAPEETSRFDVSPVAMPPADSSATYADGSGNVMEYQLDAAGQVVSSRDGQGAMPTIERNAQNLVSRITDAREHVTQFTYDARGNLLSVRDELSQTPTENLVGVGSEPTSAVLADLDNNGTGDLVTVNEGDRTLSVVAGNGDGTFASRADYSLGDPQERESPFIEAVNTLVFPDGRGAQGIAQADFNRDGLLDLAVTNIRQAGFLMPTDLVSILLGQGDATFAPAEDLLLPQGAATTRYPGLLARDFDRDGHVDLVANSTSLSSSITMNEIYFYGSTEELVGEPERVAV